MCPAITDGAVGDMIYLHSYQNPGLIIDVAQDVRTIIKKAVWAKKTGMIILGMLTIQVFLAGTGRLGPSRLTSSLGGGFIKHHICNANLYRNGADFSVFINTGNEFDGSDTGARPDEAVSWGKIKLGATPVKVTNHMPLF
jgi:deoxyhypusine synthase